MKDILMKNQLCLLLVFAFFAMNVTACSDCGKDKKTLDDFDLNVISPVLDDRSYPIVTPHDVNKPAVDSELTGDSPTELTKFEKPQYSPDIVAPTALQDVSSDGLAPKIEKSWIQNKRPLRKGG